MWLLCRAICQAKCPWSWQGRHNWMRVGAVCLLLAWGVAHTAHAARPEVIIDPGGIGPAALQAINGAVEAITRLAEDQDGGEVSRLRRRAHDATVSALQTRGSSSAQRRTGKARFSPSSSRGWRLPKKKK